MSRCLLAAALVQIAFTGPLAAAPPDPQSSPTVIDLRAAGPAETPQEPLTDGLQLCGLVESIAADSADRRSLGGGWLDPPDPGPQDPAYTLAQTDRARLLSRRTSVRRDVAPQETRLFVTATGRSLKPGTGYVGVSEIFVPFVQVGVTDRFSIGAGKPLLLPGGLNPVWITPKLQVLARDSVKAAVGVIHATGVGRGNDAGIAYEVTTFGQPDRSASIGVGYGYSGGDRAAMVMVGGEIRTGRNVKWITDNWLWPGGPGFVSGGVRVFRGRMSADLAVVVVTLVNPVPLPLFTMAWRF
jgi:hypothetical protein